MPLLNRLERLGVDRFTLLLVAAVATASVIPVQGTSSLVLNKVTIVAIAVMFFLYGARLPAAVVREGLVNWRLHLLVFASTFILFPLLGLATHILVPRLLSPDLYIGIVFLCALPSTIQSSIAFTSIARGNVAAAICSASASNLIGVFITPLLAGLLLAAHGGFSPYAIVAVALQLLLPFVLGQMSRPWLARWVIAKRKLLTVTDRGSILLIVYGAFSEATVGGLWHQLPPADFVVIVAINLVLLGLVLTLTTLASRALGFSREDEIAIVFCGSKKSLASGVAIAGVLFAGHAIGLIVLPLMLFHQAQLMICAVLARRYARPRGSLAVA